MGTIKIENVYFQYEDNLSQEGVDGVVRSDEHPDSALIDINLEIPDGQFLCIIGHSGSGKSTLLRLLLGLNRPTEGAIYINGKCMEGPGLDRSFVFQNYSLFPWMKARQNVEFGIEQASRELGRNLSKTQITNIAKEYLAAVDMADDGEKYPYQLSGGMRQRVAIARALAMDTDIMLFDEPFGALDLKTRRALQELIEFLWAAGERRKTVVFVTHDISEAILLADRIVFMEMGRIVADEMVAIPRPRTETELTINDEANALNQLLTDLFYCGKDEPVVEELLMAFPKEVRL